MNQELLELRWGANIRSEIVAVDWTLCTRPPHNSNQKKQVMSCRASNEVLHDRGGGLWNSLTGRSRELPITKKMHRKTPSVVKGIREMIYEIERCSCGWNCEELRPSCRPPQRGDAITMWALYPSLTQTCCSKRLPWSDDRSRLSLNVIKCEEHLYRRQQLLPSCLGQIISRHDHDVIFWKRFASYYSTHVINIQNKTMSIYWLVLCFMLPNVIYFLRVRH
jgi:hypothetical protein